MTIKQTAKLQYLVPVTWVVILSLPLSCRRLCLEQLAWRTHFTGNFIVFCLWVHLALSPIDSTYCLSQSSPDSVGTHAYSLASNTLICGYSMFSRVHSFLAHRSYNQVHLYSSKVSAVLSSPINKAYNLSNVLIILWKITIYRKIPYKVLSYNAVILFGVYWELDTLSPIYYELLV